MNILIVDDDLLCQKLLRSILKPYGECYIASDGQEAVLEFEKSLERDNPYDLICLDIMMPNLDGQRALQKIRRIEKKRGIKEDLLVKIIMITVLKDKKNMEQAFQSGCEAYITKPISKDKVIGEIEKLGLLVA
ncbi:MAG: response regulator [bacterium]